MIRTSSAFPLLLLVGTLATAADKSDIHNLHRIDNTLLTAGQVTLEAGLEAIWSKEAYAEHPQWPAFIEQAINHYRE